MTDFEAKLRAEGLAPLDESGVLSNRGAGKARDVHTVIEREQGAELVEEAADISRARFPDTAEARAIFRLMATGEGIKGSARALCIPYIRAQRTYHRVVAAWRKKQRKSVRLTRGRFMKAEPAFLLALLGALS